ncbi:hypothetical protein HMPREF9554_00388 [Treponema phagedenis F0421]|uniref:hypothetical protein n=1 Tax=Treponema phagedenis TaxID=162 RepID=UPI0001F6428F|nr:hypothetical protein [Treponema phagedenis]EFW39092.1 hypothetical protein HMPREF9554_00388 [Treponema phagedenis F0421]
MRIVIRERSGQVTGQVPLQNTVPRIGMWGTVTDVDSTRNAVNVRLTGGVLLEDVPVASLDEWICEFKDEGYLSGSRNLPPENARVFVLMPTGTFEGAFVLCSSLSMFEKEHQKKFMSTKEQRTEKNVERLRVRPGKWIEKYNYKTGQLELTSSNEKVKIAIADDNNKKEVSVNAFGANITIDKDGNIAVKAATDKKISLNGENLSGIVKADELKTQLDKMTARIDKIIDALTKSSVTPQDGGLTYKANIMAILGFDPPKLPGEKPKEGDPEPVTPKPQAPLGKEDFSNIKNDKVVHGG